MSSAQLEDIIKNSLANYEARYDSNDWSRMENLLGATPDSRPFNWKPVLIVFVAVVVIGGGYALFSTIDFSKPDEKPAVYTPTRAVKKQPVIPVQKQTPPPVAAPPIINEDSVRQAEEEMNVAKEKNEEENVAQKQPEVKREKRELSKEELELKRARKRAMATADSNKTNEETSKKSGTSSDSAGNVVKETKEHHKKEKTKGSSVGLNIFSTFNVDSLKKYQEKSKTSDSIP